MSISQEWTKLTRSASEFFLAFRSALGSTWTETRGNGTRAKTVPAATIRSLVFADHRVLVELERRKNSALFNIAKNQVR